MVIGRYTYQAGKHFLSRVKERFSASLHRKGKESLMISNPVATKDGEEPRRRRRRERRTKKTMK